MTSGITELCDRLFELTSLLRNEASTALPIENFPKKVAEIAAVVDALKLQAATPQGKRTQITPKQLEAIKVEAGLAKVIGPEPPGGDEAIHSFARRIKIQFAPAELVGRKIGVTRQAITRLRKNDWYSDLIYEEIGKGLSADLARALDVKDDIGADTNHPPGPQETRVAQNPHPYHRSWLARNWTGPVTSAIDGIEYQTPEAYADHLRSYQVKGKSILLILEQVLREARELDARNGE